MIEQKTLDHVPLKHYGVISPFDTHEMVEILAKEFISKLIATGDDWHTVMHEITQMPLSVYDTIKMLETISSNNCGMDDYLAHAIGSALFHYFRTVRMANAADLPFIPRAEAAVQGHGLQSCKLRQSSTAKI